MNNNVQSTSYGCLIHNYIGWVPCPTCVPPSVQSVNIPSGGIPMNHGNPIFIKPLPQAGDIINLMWSGTNTGFKYKAICKVIEYRFNSNELIIQYEENLLGPSGIPLASLGSITTIFASDFHNNYFTWSYYIPHMQATAIEVKSHAGHEVIKNSALGKEFNYCRNCKIEV